AFTEKKGAPKDSEKASADNSDAQTKLTQGNQSDAKDTALDSSDQTNSQVDALNQKKVPSLSDADSYGKAFHSLSDKHFKSAEAEFHSYLSDYPKGHFAVNAHFWLGEIALMGQHYGVATKQFQMVVTDYPKSNKVSDAELKIAMIHAATGKTTLAQKEFTHIRKTYPGTTAAQLASIRLQQLANATSVSVQ
ncbi:MAG: tol-pal system protein YbgF, partial [Gammaproteobacteria bacterium]|nr:tol-pal system protein YbgF [Gammaproteobacteria bacterium]